MFGNTYISIEIRNNEVKYFGVDHILRKYLCAMSQKDGEFMV